MRILKDGEVPTLEMIKEDLGYNPPGQGMLDIHIEFSCNAPSYLVYLLARLEQAERPFWHRLFATKSVANCFGELTRAYQHRYFQMEKAVKERAA